jgi:hypothetical protein
MSDPPGGILSRRMRYSRAVARAMSQQIKNEPGPKLLQLHRYGKISRQYRRCDMVDENNETSRTETARSPAGRHKTLDVKLPAAFASLAK